VLCLDLFTAIVMRKEGEIIKRKCKYCGDLFQSANLRQQVCFPPKNCSWKYQEQLRENRIAKQNRLQKKEWHQANKPLSKYRAEARKEFQHFIRLRDKDLPCISCGCLVTKQWDGGHYFKAELYSGLIFNEDNCHKQCSKCNDFLSGNELMFRDGLIARYGQEYVDKLTSEKDALRNYKYSKIELIALKEKYKQKIKDLITDGKDSNNKAGALVR
jgi:hypothetical protein